MTEQQQTLKDEAIATAYVRARQRLDVEHHSRLSKAWELVIDEGVDQKSEQTYLVAGKQCPEYLVDGDTCPCQDYTSGKAKDGLCKHRLAVMLYRRSVQIWQERMGTATVTHRIPPEYFTTIRGKQYITYAGLLAMAQARGLQSLDVRFLEMGEQMVTAIATATFGDGRTFTECADATPGNVNKGIAPHFARMALTRAKARCLRDALNIGMTAVEEIDEQVEIRSVKVQPYTPPAAAEMYGQ